MVLKNETIATGAPTKCPDCGEEVELKVYHSAAGHYVGTWCKCGPYSRESGYYPIKELTEHALQIRLLHR